MTNQNPYKKAKEVPSWLINLLKGILILAFISQFYPQIPKHYLKGHFISPPAIEVIAYQNLLGATALLPQQQLVWGAHTLSYIEPNNTSFSAPFYELSPSQINALANEILLLQYQGQPLDITTIYAVFYIKIALPCIAKASPLP